MSYTYSTLPGFFPDFHSGLTAEQSLAPVCGSWETLKMKIAEVQAVCPENVEIKVVFNMRHCQGGHNAIESQHMLQYSHLSPAEQYIKENEIPRFHPIFDPSLTEKGVGQAVELATMIQKLVEAGMPVPTHFVSPMRRAVQTWTEVWGEQPGGQDGKATAVVIESLREKLHVNLCNARGNTSALRNEFPKLTFPPDMADTDPLWQPGEDCRYERSATAPPGELLARLKVERETNQEMYTRAEKAVTEIMQLSKGQTYICLTSHFPYLREAMKVLGASHEKMGNGQICPLVVRVERVNAGGGHIL